LPRKKILSLDKPPNPRFDEYIRPSPEPLFKISRVFKLSSLMLLSPLPGSSGCVPGPRGVIRHLPCHEQYKGHQGRWTAFNRLGLLIECMAPVSPCACATRQDVRRLIDPPSKIAVPSLSSIVVRLWKAPDSQSSHRDQGANKGGVAKSSHTNPSHPLPLSRLSNRAWSSPACLRESGISRLHST